MDWLSPKTRLLNKIRKTLMRPATEKYLIRLMEKSQGHPFIFSLLPSNYLYPLNSIRKTCDRNIQFELDLHNWNDWEVYFRAHPKALDKLLQLCKPQDVIIDVGSNIGYVLMNMAKIVGPEGRIYGFEPSANTFAKLERNLSLNQFSNVKVMQAGIGHVAGKAESHTVRSSNLGMNKIRLVTGEAISGTVPVITLDSFCEDEHLTRVDLIKIDVEGYEQNVLAGSLNTLRKFKPCLFIEISGQNLSDQNSSPDNIIQLLHAEGYTVRKALDDLTITPAYTFDKDCHFDIIAIPSGYPND